QRGLGRNEPYDASHGTAAIQCALGPAEHFDPIEVVQLNTGVAEGKAPRRVVNRYRSVVYIYTDRSRKPGAGRDPPDSCSRVPGTVIRNDEARNRASNVFQRLRSQGLYFVVSHLGD